MNECSGAEFNKVRVSRSFNVTRNTASAVGGGSPIARLINSECGKNR